jgi:WD40 repeat protein
MNPAMTESRAQLLRRSPRRVSNDNSNTESPPEATVSSNQVASKTTGKVLAAGTSIATATAPAPAPARVAATVHYCDGIAYPTYQEMVQAKRRRNQQHLQDSGLLDAVQIVKDEHYKLKKRKVVVTPNFKKQPPAIELPRRQSSRLQGIPSDGQSDRTDMSQFYANRINDGAPLTLEQVAVGATKDGGDDSKHEDSELNALTRLVRHVLQPYSEEQRLDSKMRATSSSATAVMQTLVSNAHNATVAKVCPDRIYSLAVHPSRHHLLVCAGDKSGHIGLWSSVDQEANTTVDNAVDASSHSSTVYLVRPHQSVVSCLQWTPTTGCLFSSSYDGTVRWFHAATEQFEEIFATYDTDPLHESKLGYGLEDTSRTNHRSFWVQYACLDSRSANEKCLFACTSIGTAMHVDLRSPQRITFHDQLSEKKINTLRYELSGSCVTSIPLRMF